MGEPNIHIGHKIKEVVEMQNLSISEFADAIHCTPKNVYKLFKKPSINTALLADISNFLRYDFFALYSDSSIHFGESIHNGY